MGGTGRDTAGVGCDWDMEVAATLPADGSQSWYPLTQVAVGHGTLVAWPLSAGGPCAKEKSMRCCSAAPKDHPKKHSQEVQAVPHGHLFCRPCWRSAMESVQHI